MVGWGDLSQYIRPGTPAPRPYDLSESWLRGEQIQNAQLARQQHQQEMELKQQGIADQKMLDDAIAANTMRDPATGQLSINREGVLQTLANAKKGQMLEKQQTLWNKQDIDVQKMKREDATAKLKIAEDMDKLASAHAGSWLDLYQKGDLGSANMAYANSKKLAQGVGIDTSSWPETFDHKFSTGLFRKGIGAKDQAELELKNLNEAEGKRRWEAEQSQKKEEFKSLEAYRKAQTAQGWSNVNLRKQEMEHKKQIEGTGVKLTEAQGNAVSFINRAIDAESAYNSVGEPNKPYVPSEAEVKLAGLPFGNRMLGKNAQQVMQAQKAFVSGILRKESGAAISESEWRNYGDMYFPRAGDTPEVIAQKTDARRTAMEGLQVQAGPAGMRALEQVRSQRPKAQATSAPDAQVPEVTDEASYNAVPKGSKYKSPDGKIRIKG